MNRVTVLSFSCLEAAASAKITTTVRVVKVIIGLLGLAAVSAAQASLPSYRASSFGLSPSETRVRGLAVPVALRAPELRLQVAEPRLVETDSLTILVLGQKVFLSADPSGIDSFPNLYAYANANPAFFTDPFGLQAAGMIDGVIYNPYTGQPLPKTGTPPLWGEFAGGVVVGGVGALAVVAAAPLAVSGLTALGVSATAAQATVTAGIGVTALAGSAATGINTYKAVQANDWNTVAFNAGSVVGGLAVGVSGGGRALTEGIQGSPSSAPDTWNPLTILQYEWSARYQIDYPGGSVPSWMASAPTPAAGGASAAAIASGIGQFLQPAAPILETAPQQQPTRIQK